MVEVLTNLFFLVFAFITLTSVTTTIAYYWHKVRRDELEASLKEDMLERGMSADEIVKVIGATRRGAADVSEEDAATVRTSHAL